MCIPGIAMSGSNGMNSTLEYVQSDARGFLLLRLFVPGAEDRRFLRPGAGDVYQLRGAPDTFDWVPESLPRVIERGERGKQVVKSRLPALIVGWRSDGVDHF
jgi:hypothetical protein